MEQTVIEWRVKVHSQWLHELLQLFQWNNWQSHQLSAVTFQCQLAATKRSAFATVSSSQNSSRLQSTSSRCSLEHTSLDIGLDSPFPLWGNLSMLHDRTSPEILFEPSLVGIESWTKVLWHGYVGQSTSMAYACPRVLAVSCSSGWNILGSLLVDTWSNQIPRVPFQICRRRTVSISVQKPFNGGGRGASMNRSFLAVFDTSSEANVQPQHRRGNWPILNPSSVRRTGRQALPYRICERIVVWFLSRSALHCRFHL